MRNTYLLLIFVIIGSVQAGSRQWSHITDPMITLKCNNLFDKRGEKVELRQKAKGLLWRNRNLIQKAPISKERGLNRLKYTSQRLKQEITILSLKISKLEEQLIRKGCPGIRL